MLRVLAWNYAAPLTAYYAQKESDYTLPAGDTRYRREGRKQVAADFGGEFSTLSHWMQQERKNPEKPSAQTDLEREIAELRKENRLLREDYR